jgi:small subunit ribosomal protein S16
LFSGFCNLAVCVLFFGVSTAFLAAGRLEERRVPRPCGLFGYTGTSYFERISSVLMIRLARFGARKQPYYRVVVIEKDRARNGRSIEVVGTYNPRTNPASVDLKQDRIDYWTSKGAQLSDRVAKLVAKRPEPAAAA